MNRKKTLWIALVGLSTIAILVIMQIFWLKNTLDLQRTQFYATAQRTLLQVSHILESKAETYILDSTYTRLVQPDVEGTVMYSFDMPQLTTTFLDSLVQDKLNQNNLTAAYRFQLDYPSDHQVVSQQRDFELQEDDLVLQTPILNHLPKISGAHITLRLNRPNLFSDRHLIVFIVVTLFTLSLLGLMLYVGFDRLSKEIQFKTVTRAFVANMTHELKTPISTITLATEALQDREIRQMPRLLNRYLDIIRNEANHLRTQVEQVLSFANLKEGSIHYGFQPVDIHAILEESIRHFHARIEETQATVHRKFHAMHSEIEGDETHLINIFNNLLDNSFKYFKNTPEITVSTESEKHVLKITVLDKGIGIEKRYQSKIFDNFYRVPTGNLHDVKGFGLGLSYVKEIVNLAKGSISVYSKPNEGTRITIRLPYKNGKQNKNFTS